jgi:hypothetical protein
MSAAGLATMPLDPALPFVELLLDPAAAAALVGAEPETIRVRSLRYKPGRRLVAEYEVDGTRSVVAAIDGKTGALPVVQWYPVDVAMPGLALAGEELAAALGIAPAQAVRLGYKPFARATLRLGAHVVKLYGSAAKFEAAAGALRRLAGAVPGARFVSASEPLRATAQAFVPGARAETLRDAAEAGSLLERLHGLDPAGLRAVGPERRLAEARRSSAVLGVVAPRAGTRADALVGLLAEALPVGPERVTSHGDFEAGQLIRAGEGLALVDLDDLCTAAPADDLAWYAAHAARGTQGDSEALDTVVAALAQGYGRRPDDLAWYLAASVLARAPFPFRRQEPHWPERVKRLVATAEAIA